MKQSVYVETSIISYLVARPSRDLRVSAWQEMTAAWWQTAPEQYDLYVSELVRIEAGRGDADAAHVALAAVHEMDFLLTWNCRHINNPQKKPQIRRLCEEKGVVCPEICTPFELMGEEARL